MHETPKGADPSKDQARGAQMDAERNRTGATAGNDASSIPDEQESGAGYGNNADEPNAGKA